MVSSDRGQVLLLGGLAIAIVFLTAIPLSNSLVVTESASSSETVAQIDRASQREANVERGIRAVLASVNTSNATAVNESLWSFSRHYTNVSGQQNGVYVNASVNDASSEQELDLNELTEPGETGRDAREWQPVNETRSIADFNVTFDDAAPRKYSYVNISNDSGYRYTLRVRIDNTGPPPATLVAETLSNADSTTAVCESTTGTITVRIVAESCSGTGSVHSFPDDDENYDIDFYTPDSGNPAGGFTLTAAGQFDDSVKDELDLVNPAVDLRYVGPDVSYERTILVGDTS